MTIFVNSSNDHFCQFKQWPFLSIFFKVCSRVLRLLRSRIRSMYSFWNWSWTGGVAWMADSLSSNVIGARFFLTSWKIWRRSKSVMMHFAYEWILSRQTLFPMHFSLDLFSRTVSITRWSGKTHASKWHRCDVCSNELPLLRAFPVTSLRGRMTVISDSRLMKHPNEAWWVDMYGILLCDNRVCRLDVSSIFSSSTWQFTSVFEFRDRKSRFRSLEKGRLLVDELLTQWEVDKSAGPNWPFEDFRPVTRKI